MSLNEKTVDEKTFKECCDLMLSGRMHPEVAAYLTGLSRPTFYKRVNQYYDPERYGELPEDFFSGRKSVWKENIGWIKNSVAVQRYIENQKEKQRRRIERRQRLREELNRNKAVKADKLPRLED